MDQSSSGVRSPLRDITNPSQLPTSHPPSPQITPVEERPSTLAPPTVTVTMLMDNMSPLLNQPALPPSHIHLILRLELESTNWLQFTPHQSFPSQRPLQESLQSGEIYTAYDTHMFYQEGMAIPLLESVRVVQALSSESDSMTHSMSPWAQTALMLSVTAARDANATNLPSSSLHPHCLPCPCFLTAAAPHPPCPFPRSPIASSCSPQTMPTSPLLSGVCHHSSCQPHVMHVVLNTSLIIPHSQTHFLLDI